MTGEEINKVGARVFGACVIHDDHAVRHRGIFYYGIKACARAFFLVPYYYYYITGSFHPNSRRIIASIRATLAA